MEAVIVCEACFNAMQPVRALYVALLGPPRCAVCDVELTVGKDQYRCVYAHDATAHRSRVASR
jgi:hypothetical protein